MRFKIEVIKKYKKSLVRLFEKEEEVEDGAYTVEEQYAVDSFLKNVRKEEDGRYTVSPLLKEANVPLKTTSITRVSATYPFKKLSYKG